MDFEEALEKLKNWCDLSKGELIEISPDIFYSFESLEIYNVAHIKSLEDSIKWTFPESYKLFLKVIGKSELFLNEYKLGTHFFSPTEIIQASAVQVWESWEEEKNDFPYNYCIIGEETGLGDFFGFAIGTTLAKNFDVFCHEYPPFEYLEVSNELNSWKNFDEWIIQIVENFGNERL
jgi:hypothetical protein